MRTKMTAWYDQENDRPLYGIEVWVGGGWANLCEDRMALLYPDRQECDRKRAEIRRWKGLSNPETLCKHTSDKQT